MVFAALVRDCRVVPAGVLDSPGSVTRSGEAMNTGEQVPAIMLMNSASEISTSVPAPGPEPMIRIAPTGRR